MKNWIVRQTSITKAAPYIIEPLEQRCLLTAPEVTSFDYDFEHFPHTLRVGFSQDVSASLSALDLRVDQVTTADPDPIPTSVAYNAATNTATFAFAGSSGRRDLAEQSLR